MKKFLPALIILIIFGNLGIGHYNPITKNYDLYEDSKNGKRIGTIEKNKIKKDQFDIRDQRGKRTGTIRWNKIRRVWDIRDK